MSEIKDLEQAFFILEHGSSEGLPKYLKAIDMIKEQCVPVVRCKECRFFKPWDNSGYGKCKTGLSVTGDMFCSCGSCADGERRTDDGK